MGKPSETGNAHIRIVPDVETLCLRCGGSGVLDFGVATHLGGWRWDSIRCPNCHGKGRVTHDA